VGTEEDLPVLGAQSRRTIVLCTVWCVLDDPVLFKPKFLFNAQIEQFQEIPGLHHTSRQGSDHFMLLTFFVKISGLRKDSDILPGTDARVPKTFSGSD
jgi:hypothetical protein